MGRGYHESLCRFIFLTISSRCVVHRLGGAEHPFDIKPVALGGVVHKHVGHSDDAHDCCGSKRGS